MARSSKKKSATKKKTTGRSSKKRSASSGASTRGRRSGAARSKAGSSSASSSEASRGRSEVEQRWHEYWEARTALEEAVATVRGAQDTLEHAKELERTRREVFETTKQTLKMLLEVEPASSSTGPSADHSGANLIDFGAEVRGASTSAGAEDEDEEDDDGESNSG